MTPWPYQAIFPSDSRSIENHFKSTNKIVGNGMANQVRAVRRNSAISPLLIFLAPLFAIASFAYTLLSPTSPPSVFQSFLWRALGRELHKTLYADEWLMQSRVFNQNKFQAYPYVSNGYFGQTLPAEGVGYWVQQNKSFAAGGFSVNSLYLSILS